MAPGGSSGQSFPVVCNLERSPRPWCDGQHEHPARIWRAGYPIEGDDTNEGSTTNDRGAEVEERGRPPLRNEDRVALTPGRVNLPPVSRCEAHASDDIIPAQDLQARSVRFHGRHEAAVQNDDRKPVAG